MKKGRLFEYIYSVWSTLGKGFSVDVLVLFLGVWKVHLDDFMLFLS